MTACACIRQLFHQSDDARRVLQQPLLQVIASLHPSNFALPCSTFEAQNWKFDVGSSTLEVRRWKFDVGSSTLEVRRWKFDVGSSTLEVRRWKFDVGSSTLEVRRWKFDVGSSTLEVRRSEGLRTNVEPSTSNFQLPTLNVEQRPDHRRRSRFHHDAAGLGSRAMESRSRLAMAGGRSDWAASWRMASSAVANSSGACWVCCPWVVCSDSCSCSCW